MQHQPQAEAGKDRGLRYRVRTSIEAHDAGRSVSHRRYSRAEPVRKTVAGGAD